MVIGPSLGFGPISSCAYLLIMLKSLVPHRLLKVEGGQAPLYKQPKTPRARHPLIEEVSHERINLRRIRSRLSNVVDYSISEERVELGSCSRFRI